jgi:hypothetical protein
MPSIVALFELKEVIDLKSHVEQTVLTSEIKVLAQIKLIEDRIMATFQEVLSAIQSNGLAIADVLAAIAAEKADLTVLLQNLANGQSPSEAELNAALDVLNGQSAQLLSVRDAVISLVPTVASPVPAVPGEEPAPVPTPVEVPESPADIEIGEEVPGSLPGTVPIDVI